MLRWRPYGLHLDGSRTWFWIGSTGHLPWQISIGRCLSHFLELEPQLELLSSVRNTALMEDQVDALLALACAALDLLASHFLPSAAHGPRHGVGE
jgi:hypothetical protein